VRVCVRACVREYVRACVRASVRGVLVGVSKWVGVKSVRVRECANLIRSQEPECMRLIGACGIAESCNESCNYLDERRLSCSVLSEQRDAVRRAHAEVDSCEEVFAVGVVKANATQHNSRLIKGTASLESGSEVDRKR
jgi:hypothetical protein